MKKFNFNMSVVTLLKQEKQDAITHTCYYLASFYILFAALVDVVTDGVV